MHLYKGLSLQISCLTLSLIDFLGDLIQARNIKWHLSVVSKRTFCDDGMFYIFAVQYSGLKPQVAIQYLQGG